jgi:hypothetical protein
MSRRIMPRLHPFESDLFMKPAGGRMGGGPL